MHKIRINEIEGAYVVRVGCQKFFFQTQQGMLLEIAAYLANPQESERKYRYFKEIYDREILEIKP